MLTIYAQYSFGGYKIFRLTNEGIEEVTGVNRLGITDSSIQLFSHYGIKMLNCHDAQRQHILFVNDIPCKELDDMGRNKTCSFMMCGTSLTDARLLRRLAVMIAFELVGFLDKERGGAGVQTNFVVDRDFLRIHVAALLFVSNQMDGCPRIITLSS